MIGINTNLGSLIVQSNLKKSTNALNTAIERMTTGFKINRAKDNAANYSISTRMSTKISAYQVAEDNALMGLDMLNTTSNALSQIEDLLSRIRALAVSAQNGTYGTNSISSLNREANALMSEIMRINETAEYNGIKLFNTAQKEVTNAGKELELNEQGFFFFFVRRDTSAMTKLSSVDSTKALAAGTYAISTAEELAQLAEMTNAGLVSSDCEFVLANDIDLSAYITGEGWMPIGNKTNGFNGVFDGNGYSITNLYINNTSSITVGLFGYTTRSGAQIKNLQLIDCNITGGYGAGAVLGIAAQYTKITNCSVTGSITATKGGAGGITAGGFKINTEYCYANVDVVALSGDAGGISAGNNYGSTKNSFIEGTVRGIECVGGVVGAQYSGSFNNNKALVKVRGETYVGGLVGRATAGTSSSYFDGDVTGDNYVGGVCGWIQNVGGNVINDCIVEGAIKGINTYGIILGYVHANSQSSNISDCFYYGKNSGNIPIIGDNSPIGQTNITDITVPCDYTLQVGIDGDSTKSTISMTTYIDFSGLQTLLSGGIENPATLERIDKIAKIVALKQTELGAVVNRLNSVLEEISIKYDNLVSSRSTIRDADIAEESSEYIRNQILQQAAATLLATANQTPAIALQLL